MLRARYAAAFQGMTRAGSTNIYQSPPDHLSDRAIAQGATLEQVDAGGFLLEQGATARHLYILREGMCSATTEIESRKYTLDVFLAGYVFTSMESLFLGGPSSFAIEAVTASQYVAITRPVLDALMQDLNVRIQLGLHHQLTNMRMTRRLMDLMTTSPAERYQRFVSERPDLVARLPQYMIASMLGISPESLSRVRRRLAKNPAR